MKREFLCEKCTVKARKLFSKQVYSGEAVRIVEGNIRFPAICDWCGNDVNEGEKGSCLSIIGRHQTNFIWEHHYLEDFKEENLEYISDGRNTSF
jgi:hypothetical protein